MVTLRSRKGLRLGIDVLLGIIIGMILLFMLVYYGIKMLNVFGR